LVVVVFSANKARVGSAGTAGRRGVGRGAWCGLAVRACVYPSAQSAHPFCESLSASRTSYVGFSAATSRSVDGGRRRGGGGNTESNEWRETGVVAGQRPIRGQRGDGMSEEGAWCGLARRSRVYPSEEKPIHPVSTVLSSIVLEL
jgi:hypothetical protein